MDDDGSVYVAKCGMMRHQELFEHSEPEVCKADEDKGEASDEDNNSDETSLSSTFSQIPSSGLRCKCTDPKCKLKRYFRRRRQQQRKVAAANINCLNNLSCTSDAAEDQPELLGAGEHEVVALAGGELLARTVLDQCSDMVQSQPKLLSTEATDHGDTVLMQLCCRKYAQSDAESLKTLHGQIRAFATLFCQHRPDLLFVRNTQDASALDLAALTDKTAVAVFLAQLYQKQCRDPNEANSQGHTVLHLLARKGDDCASTLEALLRLRNGKGQRLFRIDVVNNGRKTPLDVAVACADLFSTGKERTIYTRTITLFHDVIVEEADSFMDHQDDNTTTTPMPYTNIA